MAHTVSEFDLITDTLWIGLGVSFEHPDRIGFGLENGPCPTLPCTAAHRQAYIMGRG